MKSLYLYLLLLLTSLGAYAASPSGTQPVLYINTQDGAQITSKETYIKAAWWLDPQGRDGVQAIGSAEAPEEMEIRGRGNYTWTGFDKKPYRVKLATKQPLLGMESNRHWALLAHADDPHGFLRNATGFRISEMMGMAYTPAFRPVEVVLNGDYIGLYMLTETIRVDKTRVNITEQDDLATTDVDGGWLVEIDNYQDDPHITVTEEGGYPITFTYKSPEELSAEQEQYLQQQMTQLNSLIYSNNTNNCEWAGMVDLDALARYYVTQEIVDNYESFHGSCYLYRDRGADQRWTWGPVWDFGSVFFGEKRQFIYQGREHHQVWIGQMCRYPAFLDIAKEHWKTFYADHYTELLQYVNDFALDIADAARADAARWPRYNDGEEMEHAAYAINWLKKSCQWLASQWGGTPQQGDTPGTATITWVDDSDSPWAQAFVYVWGGTGEWFGGWPGAQMESIAAVDGYPAWSISYDTAIGQPDGIIFNSGNGNQTDNLPFVGGGTYYRSGRIVEPEAAIDGIATEPAPVEWYTLQGVRTREPRGLVIRRRGNDVRKVILP